MSKLFSFFAAILISTQLQAQDLAGIVGARANSATAETNNVTVEGKVGFTAGMLAFFPMTEMLHIRTGLMASNRDYTPKVGNFTAADLKFVYFEVPVGVLFKFNDFGGIFLGTALNLNFSKSCGGDCSGVTNPLAVQAGVSVRTASNFGFEFYGEMLTSKVADEVKDPKGMGVNLTYYFE